MDQTRRRLKAHHGEAEANRAQHVRIAAEAEMKDGLAQRAAREGAQQLRETNDKERAGASLGQIARCGQGERVRSHDAGHAVRAEIRRSVKKLKKS